MKTTVVYILILIISTLLYGQSSMVYDSNTSLHIGNGADVCAETISIRGTFTGDGTFCNKPVDVETQNEVETPKQFSLSQNFPNPFNPNTIISFEIPVGTLVTINLFDVLGRQVKVLMNEIKEAGYYEINFDARELPSGTYVYKLSAGNFVETKKMVLLK